MKALFIVLSGLPASGKSTLGRAIAGVLQLPMLDKDQILEALFESRGVGDVIWRRQLSRMADQEFIAQASKLPAAVLASWWRHPSSSSLESGTPTEWLLSLHGEVIEVHCVCRPSVAAFRFVERKRHAGHVDDQYSYEMLLAGFRVQASLGPLRMGRTIEVNTEAEPSVADIVRQLMPLGKAESR
jgi:hypothetical protein